MAPPGLITARTSVGAPSTTNSEVLTRSHLLLGTAANQSTQHPPHRDMLDASRRLKAPTSRSPAPSSPARPAIRSRSPTTPAAYYKTAHGTVGLEVTRFTNHLLWRDRAVATQFDCVLPLGTGHDWWVVFDGQPQYQDLAARLYQALNTMDRMACSAGSPPRCCDSARPHAARRRPCTGRRDRQPSAGRGTAGAAQSTVQLVVRGLGV